MEFPFDCQTLFGHADSNNIVVIDSYRDRPAARTTIKTTQCFQVIDQMGTASAKAQKLPQVITTASKFFSLNDNRLYLMVSGNQCQGLLKVGKKNLFIRTESDSLKEIKPLCVLDFYVHESCQRSGIGKVLFEKMLKLEGVQPQRLGYDRPSEKLLAFLSKHYQLKRYVPQSNNYVVFSSYFEAQTQQQPFAKTMSSFPNDQFYQQKKPNQCQLSQQFSKLGFEEEKSYKKSRESSSSIEEDYKYEQKQSYPFKPQTSQQMTRYSNKTNSSSGVAGIFGSYPSNTRAVFDYNNRR